MFVPKILNFIDFFSEYFDFGVKIEIEKGYRKLLLNSNY